MEKVYYPDGSIQWKRNIAGVGLITQTVNSSGVKLGEAQRYLIKDHLGSLSLITDEIGAVEQSNYFDPWGRERKIVTSGSIKQWLAHNANFRMANKPITTRGFTGHEQLAEVGLIHMNGRIYDGALGRFVQADPIIQDPLRVQSLNRYSYVWNNPLNATDPSGFCASSDKAKEDCDEKGKEDGIEEVEVKGERPDPSDKFKNSSFTYTITDSAAVQQWLKNNNLNMDINDFQSTLKDMGISKASTNNHAKAGSGVLVTDKNGKIIAAEFKEKNRTAIYAVGDGSEAAKETVGSPRKTLVEAINYLNNSIAFREKHAEFLNTGAVIQITDEVSSFDYESNTVFWNPNDANFHAKGLNSTALTLAHEIGHAVRFAENPGAFKREIKFPYYDGAYHVSKEEYRNLPFEQTVARQLGEPVRPEYLGIEARSVSSPTFSCFYDSLKCK